MSASSIQKAVCVIEHDDMIVVWRRTDAPWHLPGIPLSPNDDPIQAIFSLIHKPPVRYYGTLPSTKKPTYVFQGTNADSCQEKFSFTRLTVEVIHRLKESHRMAFFHVHRLPLYSPISKARLIITLLGTVGSGKGTHGTILSKRLGLPHLSLGDLFREEIRQQTPIGAIITAQTERQGKTAFLADELAYGILVKRLSTPECERGCILDGFPRTEAQSQVLLHGLLRPDDIHIPIFLSVDDGDVTQRIQQRLICTSCGNQVRETKLTVCPTCSGVLQKRDEDSTEERIRDRVAFFHQQLPQAVAALTQRDPVYAVSSRAPKEEVSTQLAAIIQERTQPAPLLRNAGPANFIRPEIYSRTQAVFQHPFTLHSLPSFANDNFSIESPNGTFVLHIPGPDTHLYVDPKIQWHNSQAAHDANINPLRITKYDVNDGLQVTEYEAEMTIESQEALSSKTGLKEVAALLRKIHEGPMTLEGSFSPFTRLQKMLTMVVPSEVDNFLEISHLMSRLEEIVQKLSFVAKPCHNDPVPGNFVRIKHGELQIIDWEYSANGDPAWDLAFFSGILFLSEEQERLLLISYTEESHWLWHQRITLYKPVVYATSMVWAALQLSKPTGKISTDLLKTIFQTRKEAYDALTNSSAFKDILTKFA